MAMEISRRTFIKGTAAAGVVLMSGAYLGCGGKNIPEQVRRGDVTYDVLVIGSGGAGMRAGLAAAQNKDLKVAVLTKLVPTRSASTMAQGGMNGVTGVTDPKDSVESHTFDTIKGGDYLCDQDAVEYFAENAGRTVTFISARWAAHPIRARHTSRIVRDTPWCTHSSSSASHTILTSSPSAKCSRSA